jgi:hypothetical protein
MTQSLGVRKSLRPQSIPRTRAAGPAAGAGPSSGGVPSSAPHSSAACVPAGVTALTAASSATALVRGLTDVFRVRLRRHDAHVRISPTKSSGVIDDTFYHRNDIFTSG